ncbi:MAG: hypothetical protein H6Q20_2429 [Bacteroidetes bacterium]|nr:hypothetical protein [Bacteroidota bacterium]
MKKTVLVISFFIAISVNFAHSQNTQSGNQNNSEQGFTNAATFGFSPQASGIENMNALQKAVDKTGTIIVSTPGVYHVAGTVYVGSNTTVKFGNGVILKKVNEQGPFSHVIINKGAATKTYDEHIVIDGLSIIVNGIDTRTFKEAYGLHGQLAFFYIKDLRIEHFRCPDLGPAQYGIHVCTFEDIVINDVIIKGLKDGVHLGRGKRFTISNGVFETFDDAIALNAHDYAVGNPELGWIEDGVVENCHDLNAEKTTGFFCRILAGAWLDWKPGMTVQQSDAVVSNGKIYRVSMKADGKTYKSVTRPDFSNRQMTLDSINWVLVQNDPVYTCGVRNVTFRDIYLEKPRIGFSVHFDNDRFSRSYYPGAEVPKQEQLVFDNIRVLHNKPIDFLSVNTPMDVVTIVNSSLRAGGINFHGNKAMNDYLETIINMSNCVFNQPGKMTLLKNSVDGKRITLKTSSSVAVNKDFIAVTVPGNGIIKVQSDLKGIENRQIMKSKK